MNFRKTALAIVAALAIGAALGTALPAVALSFGISTTPAACSDCSRKDFDGRHQPWHIRRPGVRAERCGVPGLPVAELPARARRH